MARPVFDLRTHRDALTFPSAEISLGRVAGPFAAPPLMTAFLFLLSTRWSSVTLTNEV